MSTDEAESKSDTKPTPQWRTFWSGLDARFLVVTATGLGTLLGPIAQAVSGQYKLRLDTAAADHAQRLDFIDKLVKAQQLTDESQRVLARLDVLELLQGSLGTGDAMKSFVSRELQRTQKQYDALLKLQLARQDLSPPASSPGPVASSLPVPRPLAPDAETAVRVAQRQVSEQLLLTSPTGFSTPELVRATPPIRMCHTITASAPGSSASEPDLEAACRASDAGQDDWMARAGNSAVLCHCRRR